MADGSDTAHVRGLRTYLLVKRSSSWRLLAPSRIAAKKSESAYTLCCWWRSLTVALGAVLELIRVAVRLLKAERNIPDGQRGTGFIALSES